MNRGTATSGGDQWQRNSSGSQISSGSQKATGVKKGLTFDEIKAKYLKEKKLFEDSDFPAVQSLLYYDENKPRDPYKWERPGDIVKEIHRLDKNPELFVDGPCLFDVRQQSLGDCWMLASMSCLSTYRDLMKKVIPDGQSFRAGEYAGIFRFNLWRFGKWVEVIIDDRLPTNEQGLVYTSSSEKNEFWTALLEKAYAKFYGSYIKIVGGSAKNALEDFTGGIGEIVEMVPRAPSRNLWNIMLKAHERKSLMCCSSASAEPKVKYLKNGLVSGHAYSVTSVVSVNTKAWGNVEIVRVRNPWGEDDEIKGNWNGEWRDSSRKWESLSESEKKLIGYEHNVKNGEFCMSFKEFEESFVRLHICHRDPNSLTDDAVAQKKKRWETKSIEGCWKRGVSAGGFVNIQKFLTNPQYRFEVVHPDENDSNGTGTVIIALMQREREKGVGDHNIGYAVCKLQNSKDKKFNFDDFVNDAAQVYKEREICNRHPLPPGSYCVVPFTEHADEEGDFILRIFSEKPVNSEELDEPDGKMEPSKLQLQSCVADQSTDVIRIVTNVTHAKEELPKSGSKVTEIKPASDGSKTCKGMWDAFQKKAGDTNTLDAWDLQTILNAEFLREFKFDDGFSDATCWSLVELKQVGRSSMLGYAEFVEIWILLQKWKAAFMIYDRDRNGTFDSFELREAMHYIGYSVSNGTFTTLVQNYSKNSKIHFDDFVRGMAHLSKKLGEYRDSNFSLSLEEFIQKNI